MAEPPAHLRHLARALAAGSSERVRLAEAAGLGQLDLRLMPEEPGAITAAAAVIGVEPPTEPGRVAAGGDIEALWLGPDQWLVLGPADACRRIAVELERSLADRHAAVTDVTDARAILDLTGAGAAAVLAKGCALDLDARGFAPARVVQTLLARVPVVLQRRAPDAWRILVRPSYAEHLADWLLDAMLHER